MVHLAARRPIDAGFAKLSSKRAKAAGVLTEARRTLSMDRSDLTRRRALGGLAGLGLAAALPLSRAWAEEGGGSLTFLAVGDWGREGAYHQRDVAVRMGESAREIDARFVISVGDNFYEDGVSG